MKNPLHPYLHFDKTCKEAMTFYQQLFGGNLEMMTIGESPAKDQFSPDIYDEILHAYLSNGDFVLMASDMCGNGEIKRGNSVQLCLNCDTEEEINTLYQQLTGEGKILSELKSEFWGDQFAMVIDRFGVQWMLAYTEPKK